jgi:hypothetical protein
MNTVELLLKGDAGQLELPEKKIEIERLSEKFGEPVIFTIRALSHSQYQDITEAVKVSKNGSTTISGSYNEKICLAGVIDPNFRDAELKAHYGATTPLGVIEKLLLPGEVVSVADEIIILSGFEDGDTVKEVEDVKN